MSKDAKKPRASIGRPVNIGNFQLRKTGLKRFDWRDPYHIALTVSWPHFLLAMIMFELIVNSLFALLYLLQPATLANARPGSFADAFFFSLETLATVGYGEMSPASTYGHVIASSEIICGVVFTAVLTGLIFGRFSRPRAKVLYAERPIVGMHDGIPALMIRIANGRTSLLADASVRLTALVMEESLEGERFRKPYDLTLKLSYFPLFALTWTLIHPLDGDSPLAACTPESLSQKSVRLFVSLTARDVSLSAQIHDIHGYDHSDIAFGMRYQDALSYDAEGRTTADLKRLSLIEPLIPGPSAATN